uniref:Uncharacterized protein n=1 Tax=Monodelphis domestica TaxID=13616 RepID=A0A5F8HDM5_MONDO
MSYIACPLFQVWNSLGGPSPSVKSLPDLCLEIMVSHWTAAAWKGLTWEFTSLPIGVRLAEVSPESWWSLTGRSRSRDRNLRLFLLALTGNICSETGAIFLPASLKMYGTDDALLYLFKKLSTFVIFGEATDTFHTYSCSCLTRR